MKNVGGIEIIGRIQLSFLGDNVTMVYEEEPLLAYEIPRQSLGSEPSYQRAYSLNYYDSLQPRRLTEVFAVHFLESWRQDMGNVPSGWYHFTNEEGMEVFIDNATGSGHMKAFDNMEDGLDWIESIRRDMCRSHSDIASRGITAFADKGFDGRDADGTISTCTIPATYQELDRLCRDHGWMVHATENQFQKLFNANDCGWPIEHIATMILMCSETTAEYPVLGFAMERKQILGVLTQYRDCHQYDLDCIDRRLENEKNLNLDIQPGGKQTYYHRDFDIDELISGSMEESPGPKLKR